MKVWQGLGCGLSCQTLGGQESGGNNQNQKEEKTFHGFGLGSINFIRIKLIKLIERMVLVGLWLGIEIGFALPFQFDATKIDDIAEF